MARNMKIIAWSSLLMTALLWFFYLLQPFELVFTLIITAGTVAYHFWMRLFVGGVLNLAFNNQVDYNKKWFRVSKIELRLYRILRVKNWKRHFPTYDPSVFDSKLHSWHEIAQAMCQSELVHEIIVVLSFLPIAFSTWFGAEFVFALMSILSALFDLTFVIIQRYNRPRVLKMIDLDPCCSKS